ncbi:uncharacterized protein L3040_003767 [Drepanopeziza brunnea f. sp. 'multigermtubi']|uniref:uncharacterized protein n=1 Tax=Drepanopeziza brunnea f. sp. 'multigermtubi' TaxID=698441 RepID=UPI0023924EF5|nr:hypothetical protein L3040_003767 [Drepanopeziza brunnea f. sp. 'multigermtubi']
MSASPAARGLVSSQSHHSRRPPAHLSVSLRHETPATSADTAVASEPPVMSGALDLTGTSSRRKKSENSDSSGACAEVWFDQANKRPGNGLGFPKLEDGDEPPYFLASNSSDENGVSAERLRLRPHQSYTHAEQQGSNSSSGDYRSVIDDLTIENRKLKQKLRQLTHSRTSQLEEDKLFEVRIHHALPARKRKELEEVLGSFAQNIHDPSEKDASRSRTTPRYSSPDHAKKPSAKNSTSSGTSNSRPLDSAYASISSSGVTSTPLRVGLEGRTASQPTRDEHRVQSFLHNIPEGLLPKQPMVMTDRQKKKLVVQRLEQLFTGKQGLLSGVDSQPMQQQEVSRSAANADAVANDGVHVKEGMREASIHPHVMHADRKGSSSVTQPETYVSDASDEASPEGSSPDQRPTRPLDLDPDRTQVPSDNVDYIRHLGLSTPNFNSENSSDSDSAADSQGWIYLNLLVNMAQLHIVNVTPDYVREALADVSERFQISQDGQKVRWRGGTKGTRLSSDSGASSAAHQTPEDSDSLDEPAKKRRKVDGRKFAPVTVEDPGKRRPQNDPAKDFHYKPMFRHATTSGLNSSDESESLFGYSAKDESRPRMESWSRKPNAMPYKNHDDAGLLVYYHGAQFCTDLSGDRGGPPTPLHESAIDQDGYFNFVEDEVPGVTRTDAPPFPRTPSGSLLPFRPFKDDSTGSDIPGPGLSRPTTPEPLNDDAVSELFIDGSTPAVNPPPELQTFDSSGLGGTRPADHFTIRVETRRTIVDNPAAVKISKLSATSPSNRKFAHSIPRSALESFIRDGKTEITLHPRSSDAAKESSVQTEILSSNLRHLKPSELPPPLNYHAAYTSSDEGSDGSSSTSSQESRPWRTTLLASKSHGLIARPNEAMQDDDENEDAVDDEDEDEEEDSDSSIDMLAELRKLHPETVAAREREFEMDIRLAEGNELCMDDATNKDSSNERSPLPTTL